MACAVRFSDTAAAHPCGTAYLSGPGLYPRPSSALLSFIDKQQNPSVGLLVGDTIPFSSACSSPLSLTPVLLGWQPFDLYPQLYNILCNSKLLVLALIFWAFRAGRSPGPGGRRGSSRKPPALCNRFSSRQQRQHESCLTVMMIRFFAAWAVRSVWRRE